MHYMDKSQFGYIILEAEIELNYSFKSHQLTFNHFIMIKLEGTLFRLATVIDDFVGYNKGCYYHGRKFIIIHNPTYFQT